MNYVKELQEKFGENLIVRNNKVIGVCECRGLGKGRCRGNGFAKHVLEPKNEEPSFDFNKCKYIKVLNSEENIS